MEILSVLNELVHGREPVTVHFDGGHNFFLTTLLEVRPDALIFDPGGNEANNRKLLRSNGCLFVATPGGVRVQFATGQAERFSWGGMDALCVPLPPRVTRMQRRECYRLTMSISRPVPVCLQLAPDQAPASWPLHDLGIFGCGALVDDSFTGEVDAVIPQVSIAIPDHLDIACAGHIRHLTPEPGERRKHKRRLGLRFVDLPRSMEVQLQRYIVLMEHQRRKLLDRA
jgi:c-di-GMP-binding flagellar brake protein YcgR